MKNKKLKLRMAVYTFFIINHLFITNLALAETTNFKDLVNNILLGNILRPIIPLLISLAVVVFLYGVLVVIYSEGGEKKEGGKKYMFWGIVGIFVMISVWGLVGILQGTFNLQNNPQSIRFDIP